MVKWFLIAAALMVSAGCTPPEGPACADDSDCAAGEICLSSGGVFFGDSYCAPLGNPDAGTPNLNNSPDGGTNADAGSGCTPEAQCNGMDDDGDNLVDEGCPCDFADAPFGVCAQSIINCTGSCDQPTEYEVDETSCDGVDNDCDGVTDDVEPFDAIALAAGSAHTCAIDDVGQVYCWGDNSAGQLGTGDTDGSPLPRLTNLAETATMVTAGDMHTCALDETGTIHCWGSNANGQLGPETDTDSADPVAIAPRDGTVWSDVAAGGAFTCAVASSEAGATVYCWGANDLGQSGQPLTGESVLEPTAVPIMDAVNRVTAGAEHGCAWAEGGNAHCWGNDADFRLGRPAADDPSPRRIQSPANTALTFRLVSAGQDHTCAVADATDTLAMTTETVVACVGSNQTQQLGTADDATFSVPSVSILGELAAGDGFTCGFDDTGVECWGLNDVGQADPASTESPVLPTLLQAFADAETPGISAVAVGARHSCAATANGVVCWGDNESGQLGTTAPDSSDVLPVACSSD